MANVSFVNIVNFAKEGGPRMAAVKFVNIVNFAEEGGARMATVNIVNFIRAEIGITRQYGRT